MVRIGCLAAVLLLAAFVRLDGLGSPHAYVADEGFYARDGCTMCFAASAPAASAVTPLPSTHRSASG